MALLKIWVSNLNNFWNFDFWDLCKLHNHFIKLYISKFSKCEIYKINNSRYLDQVLIFGDISRFYAGIVLPDNCYLVNILLLNLGIITNANNKYSN